jgi:hypothetical protein
MGGKRPPSTIASGSSSAAMEEAIRERIARPLDPFVHARPFGVETGQHGGNAIHLHALLAHRLQQGFQRWQLIDTTRQDEADFPPLPCTPRINR